MERTCSRCGQSKAEANFPERGKDRPGQRHPYCRECFKRYHAEWRKERRPARRTRRTRYAEWRQSGDKLCPRCGMVKAVSEFELRSGTDRLQSYCKPCQRSHMGEYMRSEPGKAAMRRAYAKRDMHKHYVRMFTRLAIKLGLLVRQPCGVCGVTTVQAHHTDYGKPLDVRWLCVLHHSDLHKGENET